MRRDKQRTTTAPVTIAILLPFVFWEKTFGGPQDDSTRDLAPARDGGFLTAGRTQSMGAGKQDAYLVRIDGAGHLLWERTLGGAEDDEAVHAIETKDGGWVVAGWTSSTPGRNTDVYLVKIDASGNQVWSKNFGGRDTDLANWVFETRDGNLIVIGETKSFGMGYWDVYLLKTDGCGNQLWQKTFGGPAEDKGWSGCETRNGSYILAGRTTSTGSGDPAVLLIKTDHEGKMLWQRIFEGLVGGTSVLPTGGRKLFGRDRGFLVTGATIIQTEKNHDLFLLKTDDSGNMLWRINFGDMDLDEGFDLLETKGGEYIVSGQTMSPTTKDMNFYLINLRTAR